MKIKTSVSILARKGMFVPLAAAAMFSVALTADACTAIVVGKKASAACS